jgi:hypothetical protein
MEKPPETLGDIIEHRHISEKDYSFASILK